MGQGKAFWPPRPGDEGYDGSGVVTPLEQNKKLDYFPSESELNDALNKEISTTRWRSGSGPPPGKRSDEGKRSFWLRRFRKY